MKGLKAMAIIIPPRVKLFSFGLNWVVAFSFIFPDVVPTWNVNNYHIPMSPMFQLCSTCHGDNNSVVSKLSETYHECVNYLSTANYRVIHEN